MQTVVLVQDGRTFGIFAPGGSLKAMDGHIRFSGPVLSIAALNDDPNQAKLFVRQGFNGGTRSPLGNYFTF